MATPPPRPLVKAGASLASVTGEHVRVVGLQQPGSYSNTIEAFQLRPEPCTTAATYRRGAQSAARLRRRRFAREVLLDVELCVSDWIDTWFSVLNSEHAKV
jgi:hypothetical protein